ncbi:hypothetical protein XENTR_v10023511 [Xenopus tropicalis]|nr:hypothetical protein XENTR_v10023511 [Xenopus tropicalis]
MENPLGLQGANLSKAIRAAKQTYTGDVRQMWQEVFRAISPDCTHDSSLPGRLNHFYDSMNTSRKDSSSSI